MTRRTLTIGLTNASMRRGRSDVAEAASETRPAPGPSLEAIRAGEEVLSACFDRDGDKARAALHLLAREGTSCI